MPGCHFFYPFSVIITVLDSGDVVLPRMMLCPLPSLGLRGGAEKKKNQKKVPQKKSEKLEKFQAEGVRTPTLLCVAGAMML